MPQYLGVIHLNNTDDSGLASQGWQEGFRLKASTKDAALLALTDIMNARLGTLPSRCFVVRAHVSTAGKPRDARPVLGVFPKPGTADSAAAGYTPVVGDSCNDVEAALMVTLYTADDRPANYYMRCIPDAVMTGRKLIPALADPFAATVIAPVATWADRVNNFWQLVLTNSRLASKTGVDSSGIPTFFVADWASAVPGGIHNKKTGRPFGQSAGRQPVGS